MGTNGKINTELRIEKFNGIHYFELGKNFTHPPELHDFWEMVYVDQGKIIAITDSVGTELAQGQVIFHEPGEVHAHISNKEVANNMFVVMFSSKSENMRFFAKKTYTLDKTERMLLELMLNEARNALGSLPSSFEETAPPDFSNEKFGASQLMMGYFTEFLIRLIRTGDERNDAIVISRESYNIAKNSMAELIYDYMRDNIYNEITLNEICDRFLIGKSQLTKIFNEYKGKSPMSCYHYLKISEAKRLLRETKHTVFEISEMLGYGSIHAFSRAFKKAAGFAPSEYKRSIK